jgi:hypothetical protein
MSLSTIFDNKYVIDKLRYHDIMISMNRILINFDDEQQEWLKEQAFKRKKSISAVVREVVDEKLGLKKKTRSKKEVDDFMVRIRKHAEENSKQLKGWDSLKALREIRDEN